MFLSVGNKEYNVKVAKTEEERLKGLQEVTELAKDEGMLFIYEKPQTVGFWMKDTAIPLDIIFINDDCEVISIYKGQPYNKDIAKEDNVKYVLEVNQNSGIKEGDELEFEEDGIEVIAPDGSVQMKLEGGERIVSRRETVILIRKAKKADKLKGSDKYEAACKSLGKYMFKVLNGQDSREPEYVESPK